MDKTAWQELIKIDSGGKNYYSKSKMLYSEKGLYLLFAGEDERISTKNYKDDDEIYEGDVFEFFLQPDPASRLILNTRLINLTNNSSLFSPGHRIKI